jgi:hypothetical protein
MVRQRVVDRLDVRIRQHFGIGPIGAGNAEFGRGYSADNLEAFRQFYLEYPELISETASRKSAGAPVPPLEQSSETPSRKSSDRTDCQPGTLHPSLSWSHYRQLLRVARPEARAFYEIESIRNAWSVRELQRQTASLLYDRLAKSKDKKGLMRLATHGRGCVETPSVLQYAEHSPREGHRRLHMPSSSRRRARTHLKPSGSLRTVEAP